MNQKTWYVLIPILAFILLRLPVIVHQQGGQDEQWFSVPGYTVAKEGVPRIPYCPTRNRATFFQDADRCLMALPPGLFYAQGLFFSFLPASYATARLPLFLSGIFVIVWVYVVSHTFSRSHLVAVCAATALALSRPLLFTATTARPDLLCVALGLIAISCLWCFHRTYRMQWVIASGISVGLAVLCHPFAIVFALQASLLTLISCCVQRPSAFNEVALPEKVWIAITKRWISAMLVFSAFVAAMLLLWVPLLLTYPECFRDQFGPNVLERAGPGLLQRFLVPWPSFAHHFFLMTDFAGILQSTFMLVGLGVVLVFANKKMRRNDSGYSTENSSYLWLSIACMTSLLFTAIVAGQHPTKGYWIYSFSILIPPVFCLLGAISQLASLHRCSFFRYRLFARGLLAGVLAIFIPGSGIRLTQAYYQNWMRSDYQTDRFVHELLSSIPPDQIILADAAYVFPIYASGRNVLLYEEHIDLYDLNTIGYAEALLSDYSGNAVRLKQSGAVLIGTIPPNEKKEPTAKETTQDNFAVRPLGQLSVDRYQPPSHPQP